VRKGDVVAIHMKDIVVIGASAGGVEALGPLIQKQAKGLRNIAVESAIDIRLRPMRPPRRKRRNAPSGRPWSRWKKAPKCHENWPPSNLNQQPSDGTKRKPRTKSKLQRRFGNS